VPCGHGFADRSVHVFSIRRLSIHKGTGTVVRFWENYARELSDDAYGTYNFNWGYYLESLRLLGETGTGKPLQAVR